MRKAEITLLTIAYFVVTTLVGMYIEKEYGVTIIIEKSFDGSNNRVVGKE